MWNPLGLVRVRVHLCFYIRMPEFRIPSKADYADLWKKTYRRSSAWRNEYRQTWIS